jgi:hypothetical protein
MTGLLKYCQYTGKADEYVPTAHLPTAVLSKLQYRLFRLVSLHQYDPICGEDELHFWSMKEHVALAPHVIASALVKST